VPADLVKKSHRAAADVMILAAVLNYMNEYISLKTDAGGIESVLYASSVPFASSSIPRSSGVSLALKKAKRDSNGCGAISHVSI